MDLLIWSLLTLHTLTSSSHADKYVTTTPEPAKSSPSYLVVSPSVFCPDVPFNLFVSNLLLHPLEFKAEIIQDRDQDQGHVFTSVSSVIQGEHEELLHLPPFDSASIHEDSELWLLVRGRDPDSDQDLVLNQTRLRFKPGTQTTLIQTDQPRYKPGDRVRIRVLSFQRTDGRGINSTKDVYIKDPGGNLLRQWLSMDSFYGVSSLEFQLSPSPPLGEWTISAIVQGVSTEKHFHVDLYTLPKFQVEIHAPKTIHLKDTLMGTVTAKHFHGKYVQGTLRLTFIHHSHRRQETFHQTSWFDGKHHFHFNIPQMNFSNVRMSFYDDYEEEYLEIHAEVTESMTGLQYNSSATVDLAEHLYKLSFVGHRHLLRPGSTFHVLLKVQRFDGAPPHESYLPKVQVSVLQQKTTPWTWVWTPMQGLDLNHGPDQDRGPDQDSGPDQNHGPDQDHGLDQDEDKEEMELSVPEDGIIPLSIKLREDTQTLTLDASFDDSSTTLMVHSSHASPSGSYLQIQPPTSPAQAGSRVTLRIWSSFDLHTYRYLILSQGRVVLGGSFSGDLILDLDPDWSPPVFVLVFVVLPHGEIVMDRIQLHIKHHLKNHVSLKWSNNTLKPHEVATLRASVLEPHSLVGILVVDMATMRDSAHNDITKHQVLQEMGKLDPLQKDPHEDEMMMQMGDPHSLFTELGLVVLTNALYGEVHNPLMPFLPGALPEIVAFDSPGPGQTGLGQNQVYTRTHFPETWIWTDLFTGNQTTADVSALTPDSITSWVATAFVMSPILGIGIVDLPVKLTVFQDFFLSLNLPPFIVRGEELLLEIHVYNYKYQNLTVEVEVESPGNLEFLNGFVHSEVQTVMVKHNGAASVRIPVRVHSVGDVLLSVRAQAPGASDHIQRTLHVKAEGVPQSFTVSRLLVLTKLQPKVEEQIHFTIPEHAVPGSCQVWVSTVGDVLGVAMEGLDSLIQMPSGCGEQNMIHLAPMVYLLQYLRASGETQGADVERALQLMRVGYEQELAFLRKDGSFSAFGEQDPSGSTWLSAFVLRVFLQARPFLSISSEVLHEVALWLVHQQGTDGHFYDPGRVIHSEMARGRDSELSLTAFVLIALTEDTDIRAHFSSEIASALLFLEAGFAEGIQSHYSLSLVTYALSLSQSPNANTALEDLLQRTHITDGAPMWQHSGTAPAPEPLSTDLETVGYLLLSLHRLDRAQDGLNLVQWLSRQQNSRGGFGSTQDTVVALQALSVYAAMGSRLDTNMTVVQTDGSQTESSFTINNSNRRQVHRTVMMSGCSSSFASVKAEGRGLLLFQVNVVYNELFDWPMRRKRFSDPDEEFYLQVTTSELRPLHLYLTVCFRLASSSALLSTGMALLDVQLLTGFFLKPQTTFDLHLVKKVETNSTSGHLYFYLDSVTLELQCVRIPLIQEFPVGRVKEGSVQLYDYYQPSRRAVRSYSSDLLRSSSCSFCGSNSSIQASTQMPYHPTPTPYYYYYYNYYHNHTTPTPSHYYYEVLDYYEDYYEDYHPYLHENGIPHSHSHYHYYYDYYHHHHHDYHHYDYYHDHDYYNDDHEDMFSSAASISSLSSLSFPLLLLALLAPGKVLV